jgi:hypothetical protein
LVRSSASFLKYSAALPFGVSTCDDVAELDDDGLLRVCRSQQCQRRHERYPLDQFHEASFVRDAIVLRRRGAVILVLPQTLLQTTIR